MKRKSRYPEIRKDSNGQMLCRGCGKPVPKNRQTWCSSECYWTRCPQAVLAKVKERDKGICSQCRVDTEALRRSVSLHSGSDYHAIQERRASLKQLGWPFGNYRRWWEGDHIIPHSEGGEFILENIRTLCVLCHKNRTAQWRKARAKRKPRTMGLWRDE